jgi:hypothetical protein
LSRPFRGITRLVPADGFARPAIFRLHDFRSAPRRRTLAARAQRPTDRIRASDRQGLSEQTQSSRAFRALLLRKIFEDLNADFLRDRALDAPHAIPEPDDFPLFLDIHEPTSKVDSIRT